MSYKLKSVVFVNSVNGQELSMGEGETLQVSRQKRDRALGGPSPEITLKFRDLSIEVDGDDFIDAVKSMG